MPHDALAKIRRQAKKIMKSKGGSYQSALKSAGKMYREGKISGAKKKRSNSSSRKSVSARKSKSPSHRSHRLGAVRPENLTSTLAQAKKELHAELGWALASQRTASTKKEKKGLQPRINELTRKLRALKG